ncbi:hypothetical protein [Paenibacillus zanthoxyli]|uniref:hypothetical protein n=1 Tax=Paenibacillus zanthoxyli TaxID=369399 RepID=UPI0004B957C7|nr:hypothetical protein [Paenibacillus zanthoxyli]
MLEVQRAAGAPVATQTQPWAQGSWIKEWRETGLLAEGTVFRSEETQNPRGEI